MVFFLLWRFCFWPGVRLVASGVSAPTEKKFDFELRYNSWTALSRVSSNLGMQMDLGNPRLTTECLGFELGYERKHKRFEQRFLLAGSLPGKIDFNDGFGNNRTLNRDSSRFWEVSAQYHFLRYVVDKTKFSLGLGFILSENYNRMQIDYLSIGKTSCWGLNSGIGPSFVAQYAVTPRIKTRAELLNVFYLPWISFGKFTMPQLEENVNNFVFTSTLSISLGMELKRNSELLLGFSRHETLGAGKQTGNSYFFYSRFTGTSRYFVRWQIKLGKGE